MSGLRDSKLDARAPLLGIAPPQLSSGKLSAAEAAMAIPNPSDLSWKLDSLGKPRTVVPIAPALPIASLARSTARRPNGRAVFLCLIITGVIILGIIIARTQESSSPAAPAVTDQNPAAMAFGRARLGVTYNSLPCTLRGSLPQWLAGGTVYRNGPGNYAAMNSTHFFMGLAMIHSFHVEGDARTVVYSAAFVNSSEYRQYLAHPLGDEQSPAAQRRRRPDPCKLMFQSVASEWKPAGDAPGSTSGPFSRSASGQTLAARAHAPTARTTQAEAGDSFSMNTQVTLYRTGAAPHHYVTFSANINSNEFDPKTMRTISSPTAFADPLSALLSPEHGFSDRNGTFVHFALNLLGPASNYQLYTIAADAAGVTTRVQAPNTVPVNPAVSMPLYQHSYSVTDRYLIMSEVPAAYAADRNFFEYQWIPSLGTTWRVVDRFSGAQLTNFTSAAFFMFHHINAFEQSDGSVVVDLITYPDLSVLSNLALSKLLTDWQPFISSFNSSRPMRYVLPVATGAPGSTVTGTVLSTAVAGVELPRVNDAYLGLEYRYFWAYTIRDPVRSTFADALVRVDTVTGGAAFWGASMNVDWNRFYPGEPVVAPRPGATSETDAVVLSVVVDVWTQNTFLLVLNAADMSEYARVTVPNNIIVPFGFHGAYFGDAFNAVPDAAARDTASSYSHALLKAIDSYFTASF